MGKAWLWYFPHISSFPSSTWDNAIKFGPRSWSKWICQISLQIIEALVLESLNTVARTCWQTERAQCRWNFFLWFEKCRFTFQISSLYFITIQCRAIHISGSYSQTWASSIWLYYLSALIEHISRLFLLVHCGLVLLCLIKTTSVLKVLIVTADSPHNRQYMHPMACISRCIYTSAWSK